mmetsp:Transcript_5302/g.7454  ORF Transcript_5302/g.7454 Transcript_5302/m.7454 type:complete len:123 (-) Transcript_5302:412-780(-)
MIRIGASDLSLCDRDINDKKDNGFAALLTANSFLSSFFNDSEVKSRKDALARRLTRQLKAIFVFAEPMRDPTRFASNPTRVRMTRIRCIATVYFGVARPNLSQRYDVIADQRGRSAILMRIR